MAIDGLKGYFEEHDDANNTIFRSKKDKYLTIIFTNEHQKLLYQEILKKKLIKILIEIMLKLNLNLLINYLYYILVNIRTLILLLDIKEFI